MGEVAIAPFKLEKIIIDAIAFWGDYRAIASIKLEKMNLGTIAFFGVCGAIAIVWNLEDEGWGDRFLA